MATTITGSDNIASLDSGILANTCNGNFYIDLLPSVWIGSGADNVLGARIKITNPLGVVIKDWTGAYDIVPPMTSVVTYAIPTQSSNYQYGDYLIEVKLTDADSTEYKISKTVHVVCIPSGKGKKYGTISATLSGICKDGKVTVVADAIPVYNGETFVSQVQAYTLEYPTGSAIANLATTTGNFSVALYEGTYKFSGETCVLYDFDDNVTIKVKYKISVLKDIRCGVDECLVLPKLAALNASLETDCTEEEKQNTTNIILDALGLLKLIELGVYCGEDVSGYVNELSDLLGIDVADFGYVAGGTPVEDYVIEGCGVTSATVGLTTTYTINNYEYIVEVADNGGALVIATATQNGCTKTQTITFNIATVYSQIKNIVNNSSAEQDYWSSIVKNTINNLVITGLTTQEITDMTLEELLQYLFDSVKDCCECTATITVTSIGKVGGDVVIQWTESATVYSVDLYSDGVSIGTVLAGVNEMTIPNGADGSTHTYRLIPKCENNKNGTVVQDDFVFSPCIAIDPISVSSNNVNGVACPYDLTALVGSLPVGITAEWHTANNTAASSLLGNPTAASSGTYYVFAKDASGCYSSGVAVILTCEAAISCTAPQNLTVSAVSGGYLVSFQGASNPPAYNSYLVKRRLESDPDVSGSYTTIGAPVWNASTSRYEILDATATDNVLYTYKAESQCADASRPNIQFDFSNITCPTLTLTPSTTSIAYSFVPVGGAVDKYEVKIYNSTGITLIETDTYNPSFSNPTTGTFSALTESTDYKVRLTIFIGTYSKTCDWSNTTTGAVDSCPDVTGIGGAGYGGSNP